MFLLDTIDKGLTAVLLIDEAQDLSIRALEQIRLLSNLETEKEKLIQIILVGQPELRDLLKKPALKQLRQRIGVRYHLNALDFTEVEQYIFHRLQVAGLSKPDFALSAPAIKMVYDYTEGIPRLINAVCDKALLAAYVRETRQICQVIISEAIKEIEGEIPSVIAKADHGALSKIMERLTSGV